MEGQPSSTLKELAIKSNTNILEYTPDGGENLRDLSLRVISFFQDLCLSLMRQYSSTPSTPRQSSTSISRRASRASILNTWLEEAGTVVGDQADDYTSDQPHVAKFYVDDPAVNSDCCSSQDSGISGVFSADVSSNYFWKFLKKKKTTTFFLYIVFNNRDRQSVQPNSNFIPRRHVARFQSQSHSVGMATV